jgi:hypothetical protein
MSLWLSDDELKKLTASALSLEQLRDLTDAEAADGSGVYFLWRGDDLQYIGQSRCVGTRVYQHKVAFLYGKFWSRPVTRIQFDRATFILIDGPPYFDTPEESKAFYRKLLQTEAVYVTLYRTPFNEWPHQPTHAELSRI